MTTPELNVANSDATKQVAAAKTSNFLHGLKSFGIGLGYAVACIGAVGAMSYVGARATARGYKDGGVDLNNLPLRNN